MGLTGMYVKLLKSHPISTNLGTAFVVMTAGDALAQNLEKAHLEDHLVNVDPEIEALPDNKKINLHRYDTTKFPENNEEQPSSDDTAPPRPPATLSYDGQCSCSNWTEGVEAIGAMVTDLDKARTVSMAGWSVLIYTPLFIWLYKTYDWMFPKRTPRTVLYRVVGSVMFSIPINAAFFTYGTCVHHVVEWNNAKGTNQEQELDWRKMMADSKLKIEAELVGTVERSAMMWIPINALNFAVVPHHMRPVVLMFGSVFWNCYLSLLQHRDMKMPEGYEHKPLLETAEDRAFSIAEKVQTIIKRRSFAVGGSLVVATSQKKDDDNDNDDDDDA